MTSKDPKTHSYECLSLAALLDCLTLDKPEMLPAHLEIRALPSPRPDGANQILYNQRIEDNMYATSFYVTIDSVQRNMQIVYLSSDLRSSSPRCRQLTELLMLTALIPSSKKC